MTIYTPLKVLQALHALLQAVQGTGTPRRASDVATVDSPTLTTTDDDCQDDDVNPDVVARLAW